MGIPSILLGALDEPYDPWAWLPWNVVGIGLLVVLGSYALLLIMLKVFPRGRRLDSHKKLQEESIPKKGRPSKV